MLKTDLYFYPDAGLAARMRVGSLLFLSRDGQGIVGFFESSPQILFKAQQATDSALLTNILNDFHGFIARSAASIHFEHGGTEEEIAKAFIAILPHNLRATDPTKWPPDEVFFRAAEESRTIEAYPVGSTA